MRLPVLYPGDVVLTCQRSGRLPRLIRWATRARGEAPTVFHHAGIVSEGGPIAVALIFEAQARTREAMGAVVLGQWGRFAIYRLRDVRVPEMLAAIRKAREKHLGERYPAWKLLVLLLDQVIGWVFGGSPTIFARMIGLDPRKKCSPLVAEIYVPQGERFGRDVVDAVTPDDIADAVQDETRWKCVVPLTPDLSPPKWGRGEMEDEP